MKSLSRIIIACLIIIAFAYSQNNKDSDSSKFRDEQNKPKQITTPPQENMGRAEAKTEARPGNTEVKIFFSLGSLACPPEKDCPEKAKPVKAE